MTPYNIQEQILALKGRGLSLRKIAKHLGIPKSTCVDIYNRLNGAIPESTVKKPKVLLLDLENAASVGLVFGRFKQNLSQDHIISEGGWLLTYAYKWLGESNIYSEKVTPEEARNCDDSRLCTLLWELIEQADVVVAHNSYGHDIPLFKARVIINGLPPIRKVRIIDTLSIAKEFKFNSKKLDSLCSALGVGRKIEHSGIVLWKQCQEGDVTAIDKMEEYNVGDIVLLEELYMIIRSHSTRHPNLAIYYEGDKVRCNICGSEHIKPTGNLVTTNVNIFEEYSCSDCGSRFKSRKSTLSKEQRSNILSN